MLTIGADPEFIIAHPNDLSVLPASHYFSSHSIGYDGASGELRPEASTDPLEVVANLKALIAQAARLAKLPLYATSDERPVGGHIHFSLPPLRTATVARLIRNLDLSLSHPLALLERKQSALMRKQRSSYGRLSTTRPQPYGIEYRTPASWLATERLTAAALCLAYAVAIDTLNAGLEIPLPADDWLFNAHNLTYLQRKLDLVTPHIKALSLYPKYKRQINYLIYHAKRHSPLYINDLATGWKIRTAKQDKADTLNQLLPKAINGLTNRKAAPRRMDEIRTPFNISPGCKEIAQKTQRRLAELLASTPPQDTRPLWLTDAPSSSLILELPYAKHKVVFLRAFNYLLSKCYDCPPSIETRFTTLEMRLRLPEAVVYHPSFLPEALALTAYLIANPRHYRTVYYNRAGAKQRYPLTPRNLIIKPKKNKCAD